MNSGKNNGVSITMVRKLKAPVSSVYRAWTEPRLIAKWLAPGADTVTEVVADLRARGSYRIEGIHAEGVPYCISGAYLELVEQRRIALSWNYDGPVAALKAGTSIVTAEFKDLGGNVTQLILTHEKQNSRESAEITRVSWNSCIGKLETAADTIGSEPQDTPDVGRDFFSGGQRQIQDRFDTRKLADRLEAILVHDRLSASDAAFITRQNMFFLATSDAYGQPNCSYKGGAKGFVAVVDDNTLAFPDYDGNGMNLSVGNINETNKVGLLFVDFERQARMRILGKAYLSEQDRLIERYPGAQLIVRIGVESVFSNCPRYVHKMQLVEESVYVPHDGKDTPAPSWKHLNAVADVLPEKDQKAAGMDTDLNKTLNRD